MVWTNSKSALSTIGTFKGHKQQTPAEEISVLSEAYGKSYQIWCPIGTNIQVGDIIDDGKAYSVRAVNTRDYGKNQHLQITAEDNGD